MIGGLSLAGLVCEECGAGEHAFVFDPGCGHWLCESCQFCHQCGQAAE